FARKFAVAPCTMTLPSTRGASVGRWLPCRRAVDTSLEPMFHRYLMVGPTCAGGMDPFAGSASTTMMSSPSMAAASLEELPRVPGPRNARVGLHRKPPPFTLTAHHEP